MSFRSLVLIHMQGDLRAYLNRKRTLRPSSAVLFALDIARLVHFLFAYYLFLRNANGNANSLMVISYHDSNFYLQLIEHKLIFFKQIY